MRKNLYKIIIPSIAVFIAAFFIFHLTANSIINIDGCQEIKQPGSYSLSKDINSTGGNCLTISSDNVILNGEGHTIIGEGQKDRSGIEVDNSNNLVIKNFNIVDYEDGIYLMNSRYVTVIDNSLKSNLQGIYVLNSTDNEISSNQIDTSQSTGLVLDTSNDNFITKNMIEHGYVSLVISSSFGNSVIDNTYADNIRTTLRLNRTSPIINENQPINFTVVLGGAVYCQSCSYNVELTPNEGNFSYSQQDGAIYGQFYPKSKGIYSLEISLIDSSNNTEYSKYIYLVSPEKNSEENYYLRGIEPSHGQPKSLGIYSEDSGSLSANNPTSNETRSCSDWVQFFSDDTPKYLFGVVKEINFSITYSDNNSTTIGLQRFSTYDSFNYDRNASFESTNGLFVSKSMSFDMNWPMNYYWEWYWQSIKLSSQDGNPQVSINPQNLDTASFSYVYPSTPAIKSVSGQNLVLLSATIANDSSDAASLVFRENGAANLSVQMPDSSIKYSASYNDVNCNSPNCFISGQEGGILNFSLNLNGKNSIEIFPSNT